MHDWGPSDIFDVKCPHFDKCKYACSDACKLMKGSCIYG